DLTQDALKPRGIAVDTDGFDAAMERQREKARASWSGSGEAATEALWFALKERVGATDFLGYETETAEGVVAALVKDGQEVDVLPAGEGGAQRHKKRPFYGEAGGRAGNPGVIHAAGMCLPGSNTKPKGGAVLALPARGDRGALNVGPAPPLKVDHPRRRAIR